MPAFPHSLPGAGMVQNQHSFIDAIREALATGSVVLTPNTPWARYVRRELLTARVARSPAVYPVEVWLARQWEEHRERNSDSLRHAVLDTQHCRWIWQKVIKQEADSFPNLNAAQLADKADTAARTLKRWCVNSSTLEGYELGASIRFSHWLAVFERQLDDKNFITFEDALAQLTECWRHAEIKPGSGFLLAGFQNPLPPLLANALHAAGEVREIEFNPKSAIGSIQLTSLPDNTTEMRAAFCWAARQHENSRRVAIVITDIEQRRKQVERIARDVLGEISFSLTSGTPLAEFPQIADALHLLSLNCGEQDVSYYRRLLQSPWWGDFDAEYETRARCEFELCRTQRTHMDASDFRALVQNSDPDNLIAPGLQDMASNERHAARRGGKTRSPADYANLFEKQLREMDWVVNKDPCLQHLELAWQEALHSLRSAQSVAGYCTVDEALSMLRRICQQKRIHPDGDAPIHILDTVESAVGYDAQWLCGAHQQQWPRSAAPNALLPVQLQKQLDMPRASADREREICIKLLHSFKQTAPDVVFSYPEMDGETQLSASPLLADLQYADQAEFTRIDSAELQLSSKFKVPVTKLEWIQPGQAPPVSKEESSRLRGGSGILQQQASCPFHAFATFRLGANPLETPVNGLTPADRGDILHNAMETLWREIDTQKNLCALPQSDLDRRINNALDNATRRQCKKKPWLDPAHLDLEKVRLFRQIRKWLELEKQRPPFDVLLVEDPVEFEIGGLPLKLRIDRIDRFPDGLFLIDYKTGSNLSINQWQVDQLQQPQLPLYSIAMEQTPAAIAFAQINSKKQIFIGICDRAMQQSIDGILPREDWQFQLQAWRESLEKLASDFMVGAAEICFDGEPDPNRHPLLELDRWSEREQIQKCREIEI